MVGEGGSEKRRVKNEKCKTILFLSLFRARARYVIDFLVIKRSICASFTLTKAKNCGTINNGELCAKAIKNGKKHSAAHFGYTTTY
jgi:hypothetical protein